jgi:hypothetical protein
MTNKSIPITISDNPADLLTKLNDKYTIKYTFELELTVKINLK